LFSKTNDKLKVFWRVNTVGRLLGAADGADDKLLITRQVEDVVALGAEETRVHPNAVNAKNDPGIFVFGPHSTVFSEKNPSD